MRIGTFDRHNGRRATSTRTRRRTVNGYASLFTRSAKKATAESGGGAADRVNRGGHAVRCVRSSPQQKRHGCVANRSGPPRSRPVSYRHTWPLFMRPLSCNAWLGWVETALVHFTSLVSSHRRWSSSSSRGHKKNQKHKGKRLWFRGRWRILGTRKGSGWRRRGWCTAR